MQTLKQLTPFLSVAPQIQEDDLGLVASMGFRSLVNNRPDGEAENQPTSETMKAAAERHGLAYYYQPVVSGKITESDVAAFGRIMAEAKGPVLAFCRTGTRCSTLWALAEAGHLAPEAILKTTAAAGYELDALKPALEQRWTAGVAPAPTGAAASREIVVHRATRYDVVVVGGGAAGLAVAASLLRKKPDVSVAIIEPSETHYYQPGFTLVGANVFPRAKTERPERDYIPKKAKWIKAAAAGFEPEHNCVVLEDGERIGYSALVVAPGLKLNWAGVEGLKETLGRNGVTSNYQFDMAPYTWELVHAMKEGRALFTQPPMPIKCAGAPQKAMYLSADWWQRKGVLNTIEVDFNTAGAVLFGVADFVPSLMKYVERYKAKLSFTSNLKAVDGPARKAWFEVTKPDGSKETVEKGFDMLHAVPPQCAPDFIRNSPLADAAGWVDVDPETLRHKRYGNIFGCGDASSSPNAKTAAAVRKQAPVVVRNLISFLDRQGPHALYDGYGACPLTVERGRVVMAEFGYGGRLLPSFPLNPRVPRYSMWLAKVKFMPFLYYDLMCRGIEWGAEPTNLRFAPAAHDVIGPCDFKDAKPQVKA